MADQSTVKITTTPPDLLQRMERYPRQLDGVMQEAAKASLLVIQENVPAYPHQKPDSQYTRTGYLGRSMGAGQSGGAIGQPDIYVVKKVGEASYEGEFGSRADYAPQVIGEQSQKAFFKERGWWTTKTIAQKATEKVNKVYQMAAEKMVAWLDGKSA